MGRRCKTNLVSTIGGDAQPNESWHPVLRRSEVAEMCSISVQTVDMWVRKSIIPGPIAGTRRWSRSAIERRLASQDAASSPIDQLSPFEQWKRHSAN
jgi:predicted DNA-binding transcriptional regulator AlpA